MVSSSKIKAMELNSKSFLEIWTNSKTGYISIALSAATTQPLHSGGFCDNFKKFSSDL